MRKKIIAILAIAILSISGCSNESTPKPKTDNKIETKNTKSPAATTSVQGTTTPARKETFEPKEASIDDIEKYLVDNGAVSGQKIQMAADMVGAISGFKYSDSNVEIYEYDINSKNYKTLANGGKVPLQGMEGYEISAVSVNGKFVLIGNPSKNAIKIFDAFKID